VDQDRRTLRKVCVFCGSSPGGRSEYAELAHELGTLLGRRGIGLVYGGGNVGLMGVVAEAALASGGEVTGVIPDALVERELALRSVTDLRVVETMHERKALMAELSDGFIALPGGIGTFEELFEVLTWAQLGIHSKPCGLLDVQGYYERLCAFLDHAVAERFMSQSHRDLLQVERDPASLLERLETYQAPDLHKWLDLDQS
jgi:uncharacterized protein (TIGR00730 family)